MILRDVGSIQNKTPLQKYKSSPPGIQKEVPVNHFPHLRIQFSRDQTVRFCKTLSYLLF